MVLKPSTPTRFEGGKNYAQGCHRNASVILLLQNAFPEGNFSTDISRNGQYMVLVKSPAGTTKIEIISQRIFLKKQNRFMSIYKKTDKNMDTFYLTILLLQATDIFTIT